MRFRGTTLILVGALVAIAAYFFLVEEPGRKAREEKSHLSTKLFPYAAADVDRFILANPRGERVEAERVPGGWKVVYPVEAPGDAPTIDAFIGQVVPGRRGEEIPNPGSLSDYGLSTPFATLMVRRAGAQAYDTLFVGDKTPTSSNSYVQIGSAGPVTISSEITHNVMNKNLYHLRDKNFISLPTDSVTALSVRGGPRPLSLAREGRDWWFADRRVRADRVKVEPYLTELSQAVVYEFTRERLDSLAALGLAPVKREIVVARGSGKTRIAFGAAKDDKVYAMRDGLEKVVLLTGTLAAPFDWTPANLRAMNLSFFDVDSVRGVTYETPDTNVTFLKIGSKWSTANGDTLSIKSWEVNALLRKLQTTAFDRIVSEPLAAGDRRLASPRLRVTLRDGRSDVIDEVVVAGAKGAPLGSSTSANCIGALPAGALDAIVAIFGRIGRNGKTAAAPAP